MGLTKIQAQVIPAFDYQSLAKDSYWHRLLHYHSKFLGGSESFADGPDFFIAPEGKVDPLKELQANILAFQSGRPLIGKDQLDPLCVFPERARFLSEKLGIAWRKVDCPSFRKWMEHFKSPRLTLIFASAFMNNPASTFGHTFLRVDNSDVGTSEQRLLSYGLGFGADTTRDLGLKIIVLGLFGGYQGYFSFSPYYQLLSDYHDYEGRDLWEYELSIPATQVERMLAHVWELQQTYFDYFFFDENCSYHLLRLLEIALPEVQLTSGKELWTIPTDTVKALAQVPNLFKAIKPVPSFYKNLIEKAKELSSSELESVKSYQKTKKLSGNESVNALDFLMAEEKFKRSKRAKDKDGLVKRRPLDFQDDTDINNYIVSEGMRELLIARSKLKVPSRAEPEVPLTNRPDQGHSSKKMGFGGGEWKGERFLLLSHRAAFHDLLDSDRGHQKFSEVSLLKTEWRYQEESKNINLNHLEILSLVSLNPINVYETPFSWNLRSGFFHPDEIACERCLEFKFQGGIGHSVEIKKGNLIANAFYQLGVHTEISQRKGQGYSYGPSGQMVFVMDWKQKIKGLLGNEYFLFLNQDKNSYLHRPEVGLAFPIGEWEWRGQVKRTLSKIIDASEAKLMVSRYL